jgi:hypothetical protein
MRKLALLFLLLPALASAQYSGAPYNPANVKITGGTAAFTGTVSTTGNVNVQGSLSSTTNTQPAGITNSGVALVASPSVATEQFFQSGYSANNRTAEMIFFQNCLSERFKNDTQDGAITPLSVCGGYGTGITGITSNSGTGQWSHAGQFQSTGPLISSGATPAVYPPIATNSYFYAQGQNGNAGFGITDNTQAADARNVGFGFTGGFYNGQFVKDDYSASTKWMQVQGSFSTGATAISLKAGPTGAGNVVITPTSITSNSGTGSWTHTGSMAVSGALIAGSGTLNIYSASGVAVTTPHMVTGSVTLASGAGTATFTGSAVFSSITSYNCVATDTTSNSAAKATPTSASSVSFSGATTDVIAYQCVGN